LLFHPVPFRNWVDFRCGWMGDCLAMRAGTPSQYVTTNQLPRSTQPRHPSVGRRDEYQRKLGSTRHTLTMH